MPTSGMLKGDTFLWMVYEKVILSVKTTDSESKFRRRVGGWAGED